MELKNNDLVKTIKETMADFRAMAEKQKINLVYDGPDTLMVPFDDDRLKQVITNLAGNAFKFTPENGKVTISVKPGNSEVKINIADTGMGIAQEHFELIFEKFQQVDTSSTRAKGGTGLGLAIAKSIVEAHKGRVIVESEVGKGSVFSFPEYLFLQIYKKNNT